MWNGQASVLKFSPAKLHHKSMRIMQIQEPLFVPLLEQRERFQSLHLLFVSSHNIMMRLLHNLSTYHSFTAFVLEAAVHS
jgi:hypothetical protein